MSKCVALVSLFNYDNYGLRLLMAQLESKDIPVTFIAFKRLTHKSTKTLKNDLTEAYDCQSEVLEDELDLLMSELVQLKPALIGISLQSAHVHLARRITAMIKEKLAAPVIWGGAHPTIDPEGCLKHTDMVCIGEGIEALPELAWRILNNEAYHNTANIWFRTGQGIIRNPMRDPLENLDTMPLPEYGDKNKIYIDEGRLQQGNSIDYIGFGLLEDPYRTVHQTMTALGCPMHCSFCIHGLKLEGYRRRSVDNVILELKEVKQNNPYLKMIFFWDNVFHVDNKWCLEFAERYKAEIDLPFFAYSHPLATDREVFTSLRKAGWIFTIMGFQSGCEHTRRDVYKRRETNAQIIAAARELDSLRNISYRGKSYFKIYYDVIINNPLEDEESFAESLELMLALPKGFVLNAFHLTFFPNYLITQDFLSRGLIREQDIEGATDSSNSLDWIVTFNEDAQRGPMKLHTYHYLLFSLAQFRIFPNFLIRIIARHKWFYERMMHLYRLCSIVRLVDLAIWPQNYQWAWEVLTILPVSLRIRRRCLVRLS